MHTSPRSLAKHALRTWSTSAAVLLALSSCAAPPDTTGTVAEPLALAPVGETFVDVDAIEQFVQDNVPRWTAYVNGRDQDGTAGAEAFFSAPVDRDQFYKVVLVPEGGDAKPETWLFLSSVELWMKGDAYLTEELHLSFLDEVGIEMALYAAGASPPLLPGLSSSENPHPGYHFEDEQSSPDEQGSPDPMLPPDDGGGDDHTWKGGPPTFGGPHQQGSGGHTGGGRGNAPPSVWPTRPSRGGSNSALDVANGVGPNDRPVGRYPGWDKPHGPQDKWEIFRCRGLVYEGYKSDCPDFQPVPPGELWVVPFDQVVRQAVENARQNMHMLRTDPDCLSWCKAAARIPAIFSASCLGAKALPSASVYIAAWQAVCDVYAFYRGPGFIVGSGVAAGWGPDWCEDTFCMPPSGKAK
jgi:hypothetical protein